MPDRRLATFCIGRRGEVEARRRLAAVVPEDPRARVLRGARQIPKRATPEALVIEHRVRRGDRAGPRIVPQAKLLREARERDVDPRALVGVLRRRDLFVEEPRTDLVALELPHVRDAVRRRLLRHERAVREIELAHDEERQLVS